MDTMSGTLEIGATKRNKAKVSEGIIISPRKTWMSSKKSGIDKGNLVVREEKAGVVGAGGECLGSADLFHRPCSRLSTGLCRRSSSITSIPNGLWRIARELRSAKTA